MRVNLADRRLDDDNWDTLLTARRGPVTDFLHWAEERERTPGRSMRLENREDLTRVRQVLPLFGEPWWAAVVYSCFDSVRGTQAVADAFKQPLPPDQAGATLSRLALPRGAVQYHRTQPGHRGAKIALTSACGHAEEIRSILHELGGRIERLWQTRPVLARDLRVSGEFR